MTGREDLDDEDLLDLHELDGEEDDEDQEQDARPREVRRRPNGIAPAALPQDQAAGLARLTARLAEHLDAGEAVPCLEAPVAEWARPTGHQGPVAADWIAEDHEHQARAVAACRTCPGLADCALYALSYAEPAGVWGAMTPAARITAQGGQTSLEDALDDAGLDALHSTDHAPQEAPQ